MLNLHLKGKVLDVGCGLGSYLKSRKNVIGIDVNPVYIDYCNSIGQKAYLFKNNFPFEDEEFDSVIMDNVLEHPRP